MYKIYSKKNLWMNKQIGTYVREMLFDTFEACLTHRNRIKTQNNLVNNSRLTKDTTKIPT